MIISCINCDRKFDVNSELIPAEGRTIQCGSCNHVWFFEKKHPKQLKNDYLDNKESSGIPIENVEEEKFSKKTKQKTVNVINVNLSKIDARKSSDLTNVYSKSSFTFSNIVSYFIVIIISFIGIILVLDTFKSPLYEVIPSLELFLFNLFETLKDIKLFIKDLM